MPLALGCSSSAMAHHTSRLDVQYGLSADSELYKNENLALRLLASNHSILSRDKASVAV